MKWFSGMFENETVNDLNYEIVLNTLALLKLSGLCNPIIKKQNLFSLFTLFTYDIASLIFFDCIFYSIVQTCRISVGRNRLC